ncbi:hypothetical protein TEA_018278 [Camellia sinensis var. sinensis]|uniref:C2H2-type domain-containing protein n=1 Tax=Camellia sinensis var. sinensis TaxID=542762 RepID=A0A4S4DHJ7_CAMSN|nr:hypothetical protein TEA_018278 [Camellia sinensis var. sinensis]
MTIEILKRSREDTEVEALAMANCLMLLSRVGETTWTSGRGRVFTCKTCNREFSSFQALGGHRASHKKLRLMGGGDLHVQTPSSPVKGKTGVSGLHMVCNLKKEILKRSREDTEVEALAMANCLMLLSRVGETTWTSGRDRVFTCKTCNREFSSFQALGGHRASHKKLRLMGGGDLHVQTPSSPVKAKTHECSICGLEFAIGQALGGHMRRHRDISSQSVIPVLKKSNSSNGSKRVLSLDLNLTPYENHMKIKKLPTGLIG